MTVQHKKQAQRRINARQGVDHIWVIIAGMVFMIILFTVLGWMQWADLKPQPQETAPVSIEAAVENGGLVIEEYK